MANYNKFNAFVNDLATKVHNLHSDTLKMMLSDSAPVATNAVKTDITEIANGNGYSTGGATATLVSDGQSSGTYKLVLSQPLFTASGGSIAQFRYIVLYNSTAASGNLIGWWDNGAEVVVTNGNSFQVLTDQTNGVLQLT
jgi:hypothetical protein